MQELTKKYSWSDFVREFALGAPRVVFIVREFCNFWTLSKKSCGILSLLLVLDRLMPKSLDENIVYMVPLLLLMIMISPTD